MIISDSYIDYVKRTMHSSYTKEMAACALIEEVIEFGDASSIEDSSIDELGDVLYQFVVFCITLEVDMGNLAYYEDVPSKMITYITKITSMYKKNITRGKDIDKVEIIKYLSLIYSLIYGIIKELGFDIIEVEAYNMDKLDRRYRRVNRRQHK